MADSDRSILDDDPFAWEGIPRDFYGPVEMPSLYLSRASSPPTIAELNEALSIVRNEIACLEDQSSEYGMSAAHYGVSEYGIADSSPAEFGTEFGMQSFESWLNDGSGSSRRKTMGMTIIPSTSGDPSSGQESQQSGSHDSTDDPRLQDESSQEPIPFVGPPAPGDGQ